jgi:DNA replication protein DnaC
MLDSNTIVKLTDLHLGAMAKEFERQVSDPACQSLTIEDRIAMMVDLQWHSRINSRVDRALKKARLGIPGACVEDILYNADRKLDKGLITRLASCSYIADSKNICVTGASGAGKTFIACAFGNSACRNTLSVTYIRLPELLNELAVARAENNYRAIISHYKKVRLLILDEWLLYSLKMGEARDLLEIIEARSSSGASMIFCSQFDPKGWYDKIGDSTLADAVCDRIIHNSYRIHIEGKDSMRKHLGTISAEA